MTAAIVTGAGGFVGGAVAEELISRGIRVFAVLRPGRRTPVGLEAAEVVHCALEDYGNLPNLLRGCGAETAYHFAWAGTAGRARADVELQLANVQGTYSALQAVAELGCARFVYPSSIMQYELEQQIRADSCTPNSVYSIAKRAADDIARSLASELGVAYIAGLISNIYGPGETSPRLVNSSIRKLLRGEHAAFSSGVQLYDFIYIRDAARLFAEIGERGRPGGVYYVGNPRPRPLKDYLTELGDAVAPGIPLGFGELPASGPGLSYREFDTEAAGRELGFRSEISFREGVLMTANWLKQQEGKT